MSDIWICPAELGTNVPQSPRLWGLHQLFEPIVCYFEPGPTLKRLGDRLWPDFSCRTYIPPHGNLQESSRASFWTQRRKKKDTSAAKLCLCSKASLFFFQVPSSTWPGPPCNSLEVFNCQTIVIRDHDQNTSKYTHDITKTRSVDLFLELLNELDCGLCAILLGLGTDWRHVWRQEIGKGTLPATLCHFWVILCYISTSGLHSGTHLLP